LGFGDVTFTSDLGRFFSIVVMVAGSSILLVVFPFAFIQFAFVPWMQARESARAPRQLDDDVSGHVVLTRLGAIEEAFIKRARSANVPYVVIVPELVDALALHDQGYQVMVGRIDDPATYKAARVADAALVATTLTDTSNTNVTFTVREIDPTVPLVATASSAASVDVLTLAGASQVLQLGQLLGDAMAERVLGQGNRSHVIGRIGELLVAEARADGTELVGRTLQDSDLRNRINVSVVGLWDRGRFTMAEPTTVVDRHATLILAGSRAQLDAYDVSNTLRGTRASQPNGRVIVIGAGRVGRAASTFLQHVGRDVSVIEKDPSRNRDSSLYVIGDAADHEILEAAGLEQATSALVTTRDDDVNVYLTLYFRKLRPEIQIIARANSERNVSTLHRAGADSVLSYASSGASEIWNALNVGSSLVVSEGLTVFEHAMPRSMANRTLIDCKVRERTGCNVVAFTVNGEMITNPDRGQPLPADASLLLIGGDGAEARFNAVFS
jgi:Trk K+ transport system NAD-binding subunit